MSFFLNLLFASAWALSPFGSVHDLVHIKNPWHGFDAAGPVLTVVRVQKFQSDSCGRWIQAVLSDAPGTEWSPGSAYLAWQPWEPKELDAVVSCRNFPCDVKLDSSETSRMAMTKSANRLHEYQTLVQNRVFQYKKTEVRRPYEFPGDPIDPWQYLGQYLGQFLGRTGNFTKERRPQVGQFYMRKLDFASDKIQPLRQVLDRRTQSSSSGKSSEKEATVWLRDIYTNHYFDSWGEWTHLVCVGDSGTDLLLVQSLVVELDLLKKTDLLSRMMRGKMRSAVEENGARYLDKAYERFFAKVTHLRNG